MVLFKRFVQAGRLCLIEYGPLEGKLCIIVDIITTKRVLVDGAGITGVPRQQIPVRWLLLTDYYLKIPRGVHTSTLKKHLEKQGIIKKFNESRLGRKIRRKKMRENMTDFDRFRLMVVKKKRNYRTNIRQLRRPLK